MDIVQTLVQAWNSSSENQRRTLLEPILAPDFEYLDLHTPTALRGLEGMLEFLATFRSRLEHHLHVIGDVDAHHNVLRFTWQLSHPDTRAVLSTGEFFGVLSGERLQNLTGFVNR
jgi:hypothetical protein